MEQLLVWIGGYVCPFSHLLHKAIFDLHTKKGLYWTYSISWMHAGEEANEIVRIVRDSVCCFPLTAFSYIFGWNVFSGVTVMHMFIKSRPSWSAQKKECIYRCVFISANLHLMLKMVDVAELLLLDVLRFLFVSLLWNGILYVHIPVRIMPLSQQRKESNHKRDFVLFSFLILHYYKIKDCYQKGFNDNA